MREEHVRVERAGVVGGGGCSHLGVRAVRRPKCALRLRRQLQGRILRLHRLPVVERVLPPALLARDARARPAAAARSPRITPSTQAPIFYFFPPSMVEALLPTPRLNHQPEDEAAVAQVQMSEAHLADPSVPVFWILPKGLITTIFPPFTSPPEAFTAGHKALNYVASAALMVVICLTT